MNEGCMPVQCPDWEIYLLLHDQNPPIIRSNVLGFFYSLCIDWKSFHFLFCVLCFACTIVQCILCMYIVIDPCNWIIHSLFFPNTREDRSQVICPGGQCPDLLQSVNRAVWPLLCSCVNQGFDLSYLPPILPNWRNCYCKLPFRKLMGTAS